MKIEKFSLKALTVGVLLLLGLSSIGLTLFSGAQYQQAAFNAQTRSLSRIIDVAHREALQTLDTQLTGLGQRLQQRTAVRSAFDAALQDPGRWADFVVLLNEPFQQNDSTLELAKLRSYDLEFRLVAESSQGVSDLAR